MKTLFKNARIVDANIDEYSDVLAEDGKIIAVSDNIPISDDVFVDDLTGYVLMPGLIDMHTHLRMPGYPEKETFETGLKAALKGGYTTVCGMANTKPVMDNVSLIHANLEEANSMGLANYLQYAAIGRGLGDEDLVDIESILPATRIFSNDGNTILSENFMKRALEASREHGFLLCTHCQPEASIIRRDLAILKEAGGGNLHICHVSGKESVEAIMRAKDVGLGFTAEATPHHIFSEDLDYSVNPPIGSRDDRKAVIQAIREGYISILSTDHAPHTQQDKENGSPGISNIETALGMYLKILYRLGMSLRDFSRRASLTPAKRLGLASKGLIKENYDADLIAIDPDVKWTIDSADFVSKSHNTPYEGRDVQGQVVLAIVKGEIRYDNR